jgi:hypothetical protein
MGIAFYVTRTDLNVFRMQLVKDSAYTVAYFDHSGTGYSFRKASEREIRRELRNSLQFPTGEYLGQLTSLVELPCSSMQAELLSILPGA